MELNFSNRLVNKRLIAGDIEFFEHLYGVYYNKAVFYANQYLLDTEMARDVAQDAFITLWEKRREINLELSVQSYILTIVKNKCLNILRKRVSERRYANKIIKQEDVDNLLALSDSTADEYLLVEISDMVEEVLNDMPEKMSAVYRLHRENDLTYDQIAQQLNVSVKTVEYRMSKALYFFRLKFKDYLPTFIIIILKEVINS
ncbi:RNA polymerase sigma-70 factor [Alistipes sp. ZOR0009]|uniref:RNA polymerase sigma-70 factor n=1 Tax=Alistipes sp. ZOR0009 TaxID=1339253 RepID=UPI0006455CDF|nr:RNA polymerase sigma-70 factor [Alistipes sp. ZOR0009]